MGLWKGNVNAARNKASLRDELMWRTVQRNLLRLVDKHSGIPQRCNEVRADLLWIAPAFRKRHQASNGMTVLFSRDVAVREQRLAGGLGVCHRTRSSRRFFKSNCSEGRVAEDLQDFLPVWRSRQR